MSANANQPRANALSEPSNVYFDDLDTGVLERPSRQRQDELREAAREHLKNRATKMNTRIDVEELERIKRQAEREGLRYQTLIKSVLHKYITGQLVQRDKKAG